MQELKKIFAPTKEEKVVVPTMPKPGCRKVKVVVARPQTNKYGVVKAHFEFDYKGYVFGQNFKADSDVLKKLLKEASVGKSLFVEIAVKVGSLTGKEYPEVVDIEQE